MARAALVYDEGYLAYNFGPGHPLKPARLYLTRTLIESLCLTSKGVQVVVPKGARREDILRAHSREYVDLVEEAGRGGVKAGSAVRHGLGIGDNPIFPDMYNASALQAGGTSEACRLVLDGDVDHAFSPGGGFHHAMRDRASGFCIFNDPVVALKTFLDQGRIRRAVYVDIDAHHGDGVQAAFYSDPRVMTISLHEDGRYLFPGTGFVEEVGEGEGVGYSVNVPLPPYTGDAAYLHAFRAVVPPLVRAIKPDLLFTQLGMDTHYTDPITHLKLTTHAYRQVYKEFKQLAVEACGGRWVGVGGGGYDPEAVARGWALAMAEMSGNEVSGPLPEGWAIWCHEYLGKAPAAHTSIDDPHPDDGGVPSKVRDVVEEVQTAIFPHHGVEKGS